MLQKTTCSHIIQHLQSEFKESLQGIVLYGSQATGKATEHSDIDLAVLLNRNISQYPLWNTAQTLACQLKKDVDLISLREATTVLQKEVVEHGAWLLKSDEFACNLFETHVFSQYQQLQEERREIIDDLIGRIKNG